jgi:hypothetical protein
MHRENEQGIRKVRRRDGCFVILIVIVKLQSSDKNNNKEPKLLENVRLEKSFDNNIKIDLRQIRLWESQLD